jgi:hypothetical protein
MTEQQQAQQAQEQRTEERPFLKGDYVRRVVGSDNDGYYAYSVFNEYDRDGDYWVTDEDGDSDCWHKGTGVELTTLEVAQASGYVIFPNLTENYNAVIDFKKEVLHVGCQEVPFETIRKIAAFIK